MNAKTLFDSIAYFKGLCEHNKLAIAHDFFPCQCSGINSLEEVQQNLRRQTAFLAVDDTNDGRTVRRGGGFFKKRTFTVFLFMRYKHGDMADRQEKLNICRDLFRQIHSRMLRDEHDLENDMIYLNVNDVMSREMGGLFLTSCTGLYFMTDVMEPIDISYDADEWL